MALFLGADGSGSGNNWAPYNFSTAGAGSAANIISFTGVGTTTWTAPAGITSVNYLVVAGGGSGYIAGGGAGGMLTGTLSVTPGTAYTVTVGAGGLSAAANGSNSVFASITSIGGGGAPPGGAGNTGGSGGGGSYGSAAGGSGTAGQGNNGGNGNTNSGGGGGGRGAAGSNAPSAHVGGAGGAGLSSSITGVSVTYAGGGGGGGTNQGSGGAGGSGGGGAGRNDGAEGTAGTPNTGGGAGGNGSGLASSGIGGSGIVIISYVLSNTITTYDSMTDVPGIASVTRQPDVGNVQLGNYCTLNPLNSTAGILYDANLRAYQGVAATLAPAYSTMAVSSGKWYWECSFSGINSGSGYDAFVGIAPSTFTPATASYPGQAAGSYGYYSANGQKYVGGSGTAYGATWTDVNTIGIAVDLDNGTLTFYKNNVSQGIAFTGIVGTFYMAVCSKGAGVYVNFGQRPFAHTPPAGFKTLNTANLPNPVIKRPSDHFDIKTYTGNGSQLMVGTTAKQFASAAINKSLRFKSLSRTYLTRTPSVAGNRKTWTWSGWVKRSTISTNQILFGSTNGSTSQGGIRLLSTNRINVYDFNGSADVYNIETSLLHLDTSSWNHIVVAMDTTQVNASNRVKIWFNGVQLTAFNAASYPSQNLDTYVNSTNLAGLGSNYNGSWGQIFDGYMADVNLIDGQALTPSSFGTFDANNNWAPKTYTGGSYGTNGFRLDFNDSRSPTTAANDVSGNSNHWTPSTTGGWNTVPTATNAPNVLYYGTPGTYTWTAPAGVTSVNYLVVAGGGGGGGGYPSITTGGGGGAGGLLTGTLSVTPLSSYTVTVGNGGTAGAGGGASGSNGGAGGNSVFASITAIGGGYGAWNQQVGGNGGSGGGASGPTGTSPANYAGGSATAGQGYAGGTAGRFSGAGGGGAGGVGQNSPGGSPNSQGGVGLASSITGVSVTYAGGGGAAGALGGIGGGGTGGDYPAATVAAYSGTDGLGGGGGGGGNPTTAGARGGSGVVILSYTNAASYVGNGADSSNNNDSVFDSPVDTIDSDGNDVGNYATLNPYNTGGGSTTVTNGNLSTTAASTGTYAKILGTLPMATGKWYWETTINLVGSAATVGIGDGTTPSASTGLGGALGEISYVSSTGNIYTNAVSTAYGATYTTGDIMGVAYDADAGSITFYKNNTSQGTITGFSGTKYPAVGSSGGTSPQYTVNFGQSGFVYTPPAGFKALNTKNLKDVGSYNLPDTFGNFVNTPDLVWIKSRSGAYDYRVFDTVRGPQRGLVLNGTTAETAEANGLQSFLPNGFNVGSAQDWNSAGATYVSWNWNRGKIPGFDIVNYTGTGANNTIRHNLGQTPAMIAVKNLTSAVSSNWMIQHKSYGAQYAANFNAVGTFGASVEYWNGNETGPGPTTFSVGINANTNALNISYIAYLWAEVPGFSKFGSYIGNGSTDGPFIYTGFRPKFVLLKAASNTTTSTVWTIWDTARNPTNPALKEVYFPSAPVEATDSSGGDLLSNGFKPRRNSEYANTSGWTYVYMAFAETPFKYANAR